MRFRLLRSLAVVLLFSLTALACTEAATPTPEAPASPAMLRVVADVPPVTSIVENVGGDRIQLMGMIPRGTSSHGYEPPPGDIPHLAQADLHVYNGLWLAGGLLSLAEANRKPDSQVLYLGDEAITQEDWIFDVDFPAEEGRPNPHLWMDPILALRYAELVAGRLSQMDPDNADYYASNLEAFRARAEDLDRRIRTATETIPPEHRMLLTYHDCCPYFAVRYGYQVIGAIQPSDFSEPSAQEVARVIDQVRETGVPAIFGSEVYPSPVLEQIARETGVNFVEEISDDELPGQPGSPEHTYFAMMKDNLINFVEALGGDPSVLEDFDPSPVFVGSSNAVYN
jgi:ABC-type Zn uptake system ZnuABC Zn-binding protein ZnuA